MGGRGAFCALGLAFTCEKCFRFATLTFKTGFKRAGALAFTGL